MRSVNDRDRVPGGLWSADGERRAMDPTDGPELVGSLASVAATAASLNSSPVIAGAMPFGCAQASPNAPIPATAEGAGPAASWRWPA